jgi:hypothetical protein
VVVDVLFEHPGEPHSAHAWPLAPAGPSLWTTGRALRSQARRRCRTNNDRAADGANRPFWMQPRQALAFVAGMEFEA